jgi:hypothetical protein
LYAILINNLAYSKFKLKEKDGVLDCKRYTSGIVCNSIRYYTSKINISEYFMSEKDTVQAVCRTGSWVIIKNQRIIGYSKFIKQLFIVQPQNAAAYSKEYIKSMIALQKREKI